MKPFNHNLIRNQKGYTLIEVIIAAAIFAMLITITMVTFGSNSNLQARAEIIQAASQNAKYISEAIARDIRLADEVKLNDCITSNSQEQCTEVDITYGNDTISYRFSINNEDMRQIEYQDKNTDGFVKLNADNISVKDMYFIDKLPEVGIHISFSTEGVKSTEQFDQTIDTSVTTRNYPNFYDKFTPQL